MGRFLASTGLRSSASTVSLPPPAVTPPTPEAAPILVLQLRPEDEASDSEFEAILRHGRLRPEAVERIRLDRGVFPDLDLDAYAAIIVGGSPFEVSTPEADKSALQRDIEAGFATLLDRVVVRDFPFLGACSGNGLLGSWLGATLSDRYSEPVGGADVRLTDAGRADPLLQDLPGRFRVLLGHKEACDAVPPGAVLLATSEACPVQMFRVGANVYATQFHPEGDPEGFGVRIRTYRHHGYFPPERAEALLAAVRGEETPVAQEILARFVARYAPGAGVLSAEGSDAPGAAPSSLGPARRPIVDSDPAVGLRRALQEGLDQVVARVDEAPADPGRAVHEIRKTIKRVRAVLRLARPHLGEEVFQSENNRYREAASLLGPARDARVTGVTLGLVLGERSVTGWLGAGPRPGALDPLPHRLLERRSLLEEQVLHPDGPLARVRDAAVEGRALAGDLALDGLGAVHLAAGLRRVYEGGSGWAGEAAGTGVPAAFHSWRKRAKDLAVHLQLLAPALPPDLQEQIPDQDRLTALLGLANDLAVLEDLLAREPELVAGPEARAALASACHELRDRAWAEARELGRRLYAAEPEALEDRVRTALEQGPGG